MEGNGREWKGIIYELVPSMVRTSQVRYYVIGRDLFVGKVTNTSISIHRSIDPSIDPSNYMLPPSLGKSLI
jgi:hypothetical protein